MLWNREQERRVTLMVREIARDMLPQVYPNARVADLSVRVDAGIVNFIQEFRTVVMKPFRDEYRDLLAKTFIPPSNMGVRTMDEQWAARMLSVVGEGKWGASGQAGDAPDVRISGQAFGGVVGTMFATPSWDHFDVLRSVLGEINIPTETMQAGKYVLETGVDDCLSLGVSALGIYGFLAHPSVDVVPLAAGSWNTRTFAQNVADIIAWIYTVRARSNFVEASRPDTLLLPPGLYGTLVGNISDYTGINTLTVLRATMKEHGITAIEEWSRLTTAGSGGVNRVVLYRRNPDSVQRIEPLPFYQIAPQLRDWSIRVPSMTRCGGVAVIKPKSIAYADNAHS